MNTRRKEESLIFNRAGNFSNRAQMLLLFSAIIFLFSSIALISSSLALTSAERILYGVAMRDLPLSGLTKDEAQKRLTAFYAEKLSGRAILQLRAGEKTWEITAADIDFYIDAATTAEKAYRVGREGGLLKALWTRAESAQQGVRLSGDAVYNADKLQKLLTEIAREIARETNNASCSVSDGAVVIHEEVVGQKLGVAEFAAALDEKLHAADVPAAISVPITAVQPEITAEKLQPIDTLLAVYTTHFNAYNVNRSENIKIAAASVNGLFIEPNETVSFNDLVGLRIAEAGFKEAPVIVDGRTVPDIGGGVCQVSSTLYNAILLADLKPTERTPHFHPLGYVPIGLDATVADNLLDFKFQNTLSHSVYVITEISGGDLTVSVLGSAADRSDAAITVTSAVDKTLPYRREIKYDDHLPPGKTVIQEDGITGYIVSSYRIKTKDGQEISRELLYVDEYSPENEIVAIGRKAPATPPSSAKTKPPQAPR